MTKNHCVVKGGPTALHTIMSGGTKQVPPTDWREAKWAMPVVYAIKLAIVYASSFLKAQAMAP